MCWIHSCMCICSGGSWGGGRGRFGSLVTSYHFTSEIPTACQHISLVWISPLLVPQEEINGCLVPWTAGSSSSACHTTQVTYVLYVHTPAQIDPYHLFLISRVLRGGTCGFQCSSWELSQLQQKTTGEMCFECTETDSLKTISL